MKKIYIIFILFGILILIANPIFANEELDMENKRRESVYLKTLDEYMQTFMTDETPEQDRITSYKITGFGQTDGEITGKDKDKIYVSFDFIVIPVNENNTTWLKKSNMCFAVFTKKDGEYLLDRISRIPDNYDKFLERFEEYTKNNQETLKTESMTIQGEKTDNLTNNEIEKINNKVITVLVILFIISTFILIFNIKRKKY